MSWLTKLMPARIRTQGNGKRGVPEGLWEKCDRCGAALYGPELENDLPVEDPNRELDAPNWNKLKADAAYAAARPGACRGAR